MRTDNESAILETVQPAGLGRYAVAVPIGTLVTTPTFEKRGLLRIDYRG